jgi:predicted lipoprotein with Yx(FWY)xxD motif
MKLTLIATLSLTVLVAIPAIAEGTPSNSAPHTATSAVVVKVAARGSFGKILVTPKGRALYQKTSGRCTGSCLMIWPPLLLPKGATVPKGTTNLGTATFTGGRLQVTYHKKRLFTFASDSGTNVTGNGVGGFVVANVR